MLRRVFFLTGFVLAAGVFPANAEEIEANGALKAVTVYSSHAMLTLQATVEVPAGANTVIFKNLPAGLLSDSLRAEGKAAVDVKFGALTNKLIMSAELAAPREKELNDQLETLQDQRKTIEADKLALLSKQNFLTTLTQQGTLRSQEEIAKIDLNPGQWDAAAKAIYSSIADTAKAQLAQDIALRTIDRQIEKTQGEINQLQTGQRSFYQVGLPLEAAAATHLTIEISYQLPGAAWTPIYDARLNTKDGKLELIQYGAVRQNTGEDWKDVELTLSTAQPQRGASLPDLNTMWVGLYASQPVSTFSSTGAMRRDYSNIAEEKGKNMALDMAAPASAPELAQKAAAFTGAVIETGGFVSEYRIPGPATVSADGTESKLMIGTFDTDNEIRIQVKPQISTEAYLVSHTKLKGESPILPGTVSLFRDGAYVGQTYLPLLRPGQESDLAFGIDDQISVKRRVMKDENSEAGILARDSVLEKNFVTEIQNLHSKPVTVVALETVPVAQDKQITVEILEALTTPGYIKDPDNVKGLLRWSIPLEPKQKSELNLGWKVSWPKGQSLSGL